MIDAFLHAAILMTTPIQLAAIDGLVNRIGGLVNIGALKTRALPWRSGLFGTYDGFYTESFALSSGEVKLINRVRDEAQRLGLIATDMETATLLIASRMLGARVASLCLGTVDDMTQKKLDAGELARRERDMFETALNALVA